MFTTTVINTCKKHKLNLVKGRSFISFFALVTNKGEHSITYSK